MLPLALAPPTVFDTFMPEPPTDLVLEDNGGQAVEPDLRQSHGRQQMKPWGRAFCCSVRVRLPRFT